MHLPLHQHLGQAIVRVRGARAIVTGASSVVVEVHTALSGFPYKDKHSVGSMIECVAIVHGRGLQAYQ